MKSIIQNIKNIWKRFGRGAVCAAAVVGLCAISATPAHAAQHKFNSFISLYDPSVNPSDGSGQSVSLLVNTNVSGGLYTASITNVIVGTTNGMTNTYGLAGVPWFVQGQSYGVTYGTNLAMVGNWGTNSALVVPWQTPFLNPPVWAQFGGATNVYGSYNCFYVMHAAGTTNTLGGVADGNAWSDVKTWSDANGDAAPATLVMSVCGNVANATNVVTATFASMYDPWQTNSTTITLAATLIGTNVITVTTNLTAGQMTGASRYRCTQLVCSTNGVIDMVYVPQLGLSGFIP